MAIISVPGPYSGKSYSINIAGDAPTVDEQYRIDAYVRGQEQGFLQEYEQAWGSPMDTGESTGVLNYLGEFPKGVARGAVGLGESALLGASTALPESWELGAREGIRSLAYNLKPQADLGLEDTVSGKFGEAIGSVAGTYAPALIPVVGPYLTAGISGLAGTGEASERARAAGATEEERNLASLQGFGVGLTGAIPLAGPISRVATGKGTRDIVLRVLEQAGLEGAQEAAEGLLQNAIQQGYDPDQILSEGLAEQAGYGAGAGGFVQLLADLMLKGRLRTPGNVPSEPADAAAISGTTPAAPTTPDVAPPAALGDTLDEAELAALGAEEATATDAQRSLAVLDSLGVSPNAGMRKRVQAKNYAPDGAELIAELNAYKRVWSSNAAMQEANPTLPARIDAYIASIAKEGEGDTVSAGADLGRSGVGVPSPAPSVAGGGAEARAGVDTAGAPALDDGAVGIAGADVGSAINTAGVEPGTVATEATQPTEPTAAGEQYVVPGVDALTTEEIANAQRAELEKARADMQRPADEGLFAEPKAMDDLVDMAKRTARTGTERLQKYPLANAIGKVSPVGEVANELKIAGITPKTHPGMFDARGVKDPDDVRARPDALTAYAGAIPADETGNAFDRTAFLNALIDEANGAPVQVGKQAELQAAKQARDTAERDARAGEQAAAPEPIPTRSWNVSEPDMDIRTPQERYDDIRFDLNDYLREAGLQLNTADYNAALDSLVAYGGSIPDAIQTSRENLAVEQAPQTPAMDTTAFDAWLERAVDAALKTDTAPSAGVANKQAGAKVSKRFSKADYAANARTAFEQGNPFRAEVLVEPDEIEQRKATLAQGLGSVVDAPATSQETLGGRTLGTAGQNVPAGAQPAARPAPLTEQAAQAEAALKTRMDELLVSAWESKIAALPKGTADEIRSFVTEPGDVADPTTAADRRAVHEIVRVKRIDPKTKKLPGMENAEAAKRYFDKFPTLPEALELIARDLATDPKVARLISNDSKVGKTGEDGTLPDHAEAVSFLDTLVGPKVAPKAAEWVKQFLSPQATAYLQAEVSRLKRGENIARRRVVRQRIMAERKSELEQELAAAQAQSEALAEAKAWTQVSQDRSKVSLAPLPPSVVASQEQLAQAKRPTVARRKGEKGSDYAVRVLRPDLTAEQIAALSPAEVVRILSDGYASQEFLGGSLYSRVSSARQEYQMHTPLDGVAIAALRNGNIRAALEYTAARTADTQMRKLINAISANIGNTQVAVISASHPDLLVSESTKLADAYGLYYPKQDTVVLNADKPLSVATLVHEAMHAVTIAELRKPNSTLRAELQGILDATADIVAPYMPGDFTVEEFVAELKTNPDMRARLAQLNTKGLPLPPQSFGDSVLGWFKTIMRKFVKRLGRSIGEPTALERADYLIDMAITPERIDAPDVLYSKRQGTGTSSVMDGVRAVVNATKSDSREKIAEDVSAYMNTASTGTKRLLLSVMTTLSVGDLAKKLGIANPYGMMRAVQEREAAISRANDKINILRTRFNKLSETDRKTLDILMPASSAEGTDVTLSDDHYTKWWLAYETLDADGNVTGQRRVKADSALARDQLVMRLNTNPQGKRTSARAVHDPDPAQIRAFKELQAMYKTLSPEGQRMYSDTRDAYKKMYDDLWNVLRGNIETILPNDKELAAKVKQSAYTMILGKGEITPYFPLVREGDFVLEFSMFNPVTKSTEPVVKRFESPLARSNFIAALKDNENASKDANGEPIVTAYKGDEFAASGMINKSAFVGSTVQLLSQYNQKHGGTDKAISDDVMQELAQMLVNMAPEGSVARQFHRRKNIAGYAESVDMAFEKRGYSVAGAAARYAYSKKIRDLQTQYREEASKNPDENKVLVLNELAELGNTVLAPQDTAVERAARAANKVTYIYTLLGSPASAIVNTSGMINVTYPQLGGEYGYGKATSAMTRAAREFVGSGFRRAGSMQTSQGQEIDTMRSMPSLDNYYITNEDTGEFTVNPAVATTAKKRARAEELLPLMQLLGDRGMSHKSMFYDSAGLEDGGRTRNNLDRSLAFFGAPFHMVERMNRQVTAIAVYDLEMQRMRDKPTAEEKAMTPEERAEKAAEKAVYDAQRLNGSASMSTAPRLTQRGLGRVMFMYKNYGITISTVLYQTARQVAINMHGGNVELRNQAMKQLVGHLGTTFLMAGVHGLPMYGLFAMIGNALRDDDELTVEEATRLWMGELPYKGVINHVTGFEVSDRVGLSGLLYRQNKFNSDPSAEESLVQLIGGAPWAIATRIGRGVNDIMGGEYQRGVESLMPVAVSNLLQTARFASEGGVRTRQGNFIYEDPSVSELFGKAIGFNMAELVRRNDRASEVSRIGKAVQDEKTRLLTRLFVASRSGDTAEVQRTMQRIREFNETTGRRYPEAAIDGDTIRSSTRRRVQNISEMLNGVSTNPQVAPVLIEQYKAMIDGITRG